MISNKRKTVVLIIVLSGIALTFFLISLGEREDIQALSVIGVGVFFLTVFAGITVWNSAFRKHGSGKALRESEKTAKKYEPLLLDERTKQEPEVQRLLQYPTVQKTFFDPEFLKTAEAQNDPQVRDLLAVLDNIIAVRTAEGTYPSDPQQIALSGNSAYANILMQREKEQREKEKNKPRRIAGTILMIMGVLMFVVPFFAVFILSGNGSELSGKIASFLFSAAPVAMALIVVGSILKK